MTPERKQRDPDTEAPSLHRRYCQASNEILGGDQRAQSRRRSL